MLAPVSGKAAGQPALQQTAAAGRPAGSAVGETGQRLQGEQAAGNATPTGRIAGRINNRVESRIRNRIDRNYSLNLQPASAVEAAQQNGRKRR